MLWLRYAGLPNVDRYRQDIVASIEKSTGMAVSVKSIEGGWGGLRPVLSLEGVTIADRAGRAAFQLARAEATLSWWALLGGKLRFHDVDLYRPDLVLRRGADGLIYLADKPVNAAGPGDDGAFTEWLLAQPRLGIHDATLTWRDDFVGAPEVRLGQVEISVENRHGRHRGLLAAVPPGELAGRIEMRADVALVRQGSQWRASGQAYAQALNADLARLRDHLPVPETLRSGAGSVRVWLQFTPQGVSEIVGDLRVRDARAQLAADALPLELASLSGRATYRVTPTGFQFATEGLRFRLPFGDEAQPGNFSLTRSAPAGGPARMEVAADGIDVKIAATLVDYFPLPRDVKDRVLRFAPRGSISEAAVSWTEGEPRAYSVRGRFADLAVNAVDRFPGVSGLDGSIEGTEAGGELRLEGKDAVFTLAHLFRAPIPLDVVEARASWKPVGDALEVTVAEAHLANAEAEARFSGTWRSLPPQEGRVSPGFVDLKGAFTRGRVASAANYIPHRLARTRDWLEQALTAGDITAARFEVRGDLWEFPFGPGSEGRLLFEADVKGARLRYHPSWPAIEGIDGVARFENRRMEIRAAAGTIFASPIRAATAVVEDLRAQPPVLVVQGEIATSGADTVRFLRESPLATGPGAFTRAIGVEGPATLALRLDYPFSGTEPLRVAGDYRFQGATATAGASLALREVQGVLSFTEKGVRASGITGTLFGERATLDLASQPDGRVLTTLAGRIGAAALGAYVPEPIALRTSGALAWKATIQSGARGTDLALSSDLQGLGVALPEPFAKTAGAARPLALEIARLGSDTEVTTAKLAGEVYGRFARIQAEGAPRWQAAIKMGAPISDEPARDGLWLYGAAPFLDVDAWQGVFGAAREASARDRAQGLELRGVDLRLGRVRYSGREFERMAARLERHGMEWRGKVESPLVAGDLRWDPQGKGRAVARLQRLSIPEQTAQPGVAAEMPAPDQDPPSLDVVAEEFEFRGRKLGRLELRAEHAGDEWRIDRLNIDAGHATFASSGAWKRTGTASITALKIALEVKNLNALMGQFGYGDYLKRGDGRLEGTLAWPGYPYQFATGILSGNFKVEAHRGQFAKLEPGAGKLLGLLSLQSLPRRALLDFRDVFSDGFAFEAIEGDVQVARGVLATEDFEISGPSAFVSLSGEVSLPHETQALTMRVVPEVGEGMALAATVFGTPVLGLSTLLVSKLLRNPLGKAVAYEYQVTGSWDNPVVTRTSAPPAKAAAAAEAPK